MYLIESAWHVPGITFMGQKIGEPNNFKIFLEYEKPNNGLSLIFAHIENVSI